MSLTWDDLTVSFKHLDRAKLVGDWQRHVGSSLPIFITSMGDAFLQKNAGEIFLLITDGAEFERLRIHIRYSEIIS